MSLSPNSILKGLIDRPVTIDDWQRSDKYFEGFLIPKDEVLELATKNAEENGLPAIAVGPAEGKLLHLVARTMGAKRILEVGTLGGFSAIWFGRAVPEDGEVLTHEINPKHAEVARKNLEVAGLSKKVTVVVGPAIDSLKKLRDEPKFDLAFIDADKDSNVAYVTEAKRLVRSGGVIIVDNVVRFGLVADPSTTSPPIEGVRAMLKALQTDTDLECTVIGTATGRGGYDGFMYALRK
ncbi:S-adenosyl-L-methionine-dependent methyltransferase [Fistulina hepatica ATCC 64428]|uniref:S-adenosyl-L-methionine-dependent methyltransferase n=1 Tax=Fistulina hepatica ATCC 64428 TaxID=1128425 RepID=A0A0D7A5Z3_9AGAR|nr:S-adenosyl-L-methionine-dependent methyltransferase [Fistulina hepatica ATCC 64428]